MNFQRVWFHLTVLWQDKFKAKIFCGIMLLQSSSVIVILSKSTRGRGPRRGEEYSLTFNTGECVQIFGVRDLTFNVI